MCLQVFFPVGLIQMFHHFGAFLRLQRPLVSVLADVGVGHLDDVELGVDSQLVEELLEVRLHLHVVVLQLGDGEQTQLGIPPGLVLPEEEGKQHEQAAVVDHPPDVDVARGLKIPLWLLFLPFKPSYWKQGSFLHFSAPKWHI